MSDQLEISDGKGRQRRIAVGQATFVLGSGPAVDLRLTVPGVEPEHLRFVRSDGAVRVEPVRAGATVQVNGEALLCKELGAGDVVEVAGISLRWLPAALPSPVPAPAARRSPPRTGPAAAKRERAKDRAGRAPARGLRQVAPIAAVFFGLLLVAVLLLRHFAGSTWPQSPEHYVELARAQLSNQQPQRALDTLAFALREATGETRIAAQQLEADIRRLQLETAEMPKVVNARGEHDVLLGFVGRHLRERAERSAAREFVRLCDQWLERHRELCTRHADGQPLLRAVEQERARFVGPAELSEPDRPADVIFAARSRLVFQWRDYKGAIARIDRFLAGDPGNTEVAKERAAIVGEGEAWMQSRLRTVDQLLARGDQDNAARDLTQLERWSMLPQWEAAIAERRQRLPK